MSAAQYVRQDRLAGKVALVTGSGNGIGKEIAISLAAQGAKVVVADMAGANATAEWIRSTDGAAVPIDVDLRYRAERDQLIDRAVKACGQLDVLVNNAAAHGPRVPLTELGYEDWDQIIETNLTSTAFLSREAARTMGEDGAIVNIASIQERFPVPDFSAYIASKGGITALSRALAVELAPSVRVNLVAPGVIATDSFWTTPGALRRQHDEKEQRQATLLGRTGDPREVASAVAFLASAEASFITGVTLTVDGGRTLSRLPDPLVSG